MIKPMSNRELAEMAHLIGHSLMPVEPTESGARWTASCSCGARTTTRRTQVDALRSMLHHLKKEVWAYSDTGLPLPDIPLPGADRTVWRRGKPDTPRNAGKTAGAAPGNVRSSA